MDKWELVGRVVSSPRKRALLKALTAGPLTPTQLSKKVGIKLSNTSDALSELVELRLVEMLTPSNMRKGRLFRISKRGREIVSETAVA